MRAIHARLGGFILLLGVACAAAPAPAQSLWMPRGDDRAVLIEVLKPNIDEGEDFATFAAFIGARTAISSSLSLTGEFSLARFGFEDESSFSLGNFYLGIETDSRGKTLFGEAGVRVPTSSTDEEIARIIGLVSDNSRWEAFFIETVTLQAGINVRRVEPNGAFLRLRLLPALAIPSDGDTELWLNYAAQLGYEGSAARLGAGVVARTLLTESGDFFADRSLAQIDLHGDFGGGTVRPGVDVKFPLDEGLRELASVIFGVSLGFSY